MLFCIIRKLIWLIIYLDLLSLLICLIIFWLFLTLFLLASLLVCLLTLSLSINIKNLCLFFHSLPISADFQKFRPHLLFWHPRPPLVYQAPKSMQRDPLNTCKLDRKENIFDIYVESIAFRIKILINITLI